MMYRSGKVGGAVIGRYTAGLSGICTDRVIMAALELLIAYKLFIDCYFLVPVC